MKNTFTVNALAAFLPLFLSGCAGMNHIAQPGDSVQVDFTCRLTDGGLVETTHAQVAGDDTSTKSLIFSLRDHYRPAIFKVSPSPENLQPQPFDPLQQKISVAIASRVNELPLGQTTQLQLQSSLIENFPPNDRYLQMATKYTEPRTKEIPLAEFKKSYGSTPLVKGSIIDKDSKYRGVIRAISKDSVTVYYSTREGAKVSLALGDAFVHELDAKQFEIRMDVHQGQLIPRVGDLPGRVTAIDEDIYTVDFGQSFAGETLYCDVTAQPYTPKQKTKKTSIDWIEDFDKGLESARLEGKPIVLFLYSDNCPYCHQMMEKTFPDPSLDSFKNSFVWLKINSEKRSEYANRFGQQGFPLTLVLNGDGSELMKLSGLQHVTTLAYKLDKLLTQRKNN